MKKTKKCKQCNKRQPIFEYHKSPSCKDGFRVICKKCVGINKRIIYAENREKFIEYKREYRLQNIKKLRAQNNTLKAKKRTQINKRRNEIRRQRRKNDPQFRIIENMRSRIRDILKNKKQNTTIELLGCSIYKLKLHLEQQFKNGMNWDNYGFYGWHIDHIKPCSSFDLTDPNQQKICFHYTNLQPLWAKDNLCKGSKLFYTTSN